MSWGDENTVFAVVKNHEEQYSIWPTYKAVPDGWTLVGKQGSRQSCLAYIDEVWTDMRPLSLRKSLDERETQEEINESGCAAVRIRAVCRAKHCFSRVAAGLRIRQSFP